MTNQDDLTEVERDMQSCNDNYEYSYVVGNKSDRKDNWRENAFYTNGCWVAFNPNGVPVVVSEPEHKEAGKDE